MPHRGSPPPPLNLHFLIILAVPVSAFLLLFFAAPFTSHKIRPPTSAVKSSWDSLNIFLVLFAILCGIFAKRNDDDSTPNDSVPQNNNLSRSDHEKPARPVPKQWFDQLQDHNRFNQTVSDTPATGVTRLKRSSSSYPDLRQESFWETGDDRFRFFDDFEIHKYQSSAASSSSTDCIHHRRQPTFDDSEIKEIAVDTSFHSSSPPPPQSPAPPPPPPPPLPQTTRQKRSKTYNSVPRREKPSNKVPTPPPPPPRPPPSPLATKIIRSGGKSERKRNNATKEIKMVFASLYNQRKRKKKQRTKSVSSEKDDSSPHTSPEQPSVTQQPPPPPPLPPPPSVFHNLFRKGSRIKRIHSFSAPPPPPPPPRYNRRNHVPPPPPAPPTLPPRRSHQTTSGRPPLPTRVTNNFYEENVNSGGQSPLIPMPPPPPPPPFRVPGFRFVMKGDFVNIRSAQSSRCGSPDPEEVEKESTEGVITMDGKGKTSLGTHFCPSPDVNLKADSFIARLRDEWMLEKVNSWREKAKAGHGPGPMTGR